MDSFQGFKLAIQKCTSLSSLSGEIANKSDSDSILFDENGTPCHPIIDGEENSKSTADNYLTNQLHDLGGSQFRAQYTKSPQNNLIQANYGINSEFDL